MMAANYEEEMDMQEYKRQIVEAANAIRARVDSIPDTALVLGFRRFCGADGKRGAHSL